MYQVLISKSYKAEDKGKLIEVPLPASIQEDSVVCFYFAASSCPTTRSFTPVLAKVCEELIKDEEDVVVIYVSFDQDDDTFESHFKEMPSSWLAVPRGSSSEAYLAARFGVKGIPRLAVVDSDGRTISTNARKEVIERGAAGFPWEMEEHLHPTDYSYFWVLTLMFAAAAWIFGYAWREGHLERFFGVA